MTFEEIDREFDLLKEYMKDYIDSLGFVWNPILIGQRKMSPKEIMDIYRQTGDLIFNDKTFHNGSHFKVSEPLTFENWKKYKEDVFHQPFTDAVSVNEPWFQQLNESKIRDNGKVLHTRRR
jgi:hypothetical protein